MTAAGGLSLGLHRAGFDVLGVTAAIAALSPEQQREWTEARSEWVAVHGRQPTDGLDLAGCWTPEQRDAIRAALTSYAEAATDARALLRAITQWSHRLGVSLACSVAREALRYVPADEPRPLRAIETAERWVRGEASAEECRAAYAAADAAAADASYASWSAAHSAELARLCKVVAAALRASEML